MESSIPENRIVASVNNLLCLTSDLISWTSNFVMTHCDQSIDVSSATGVQIPQIMQSLKGPEAGTYLPKRVYEINQNTEQLQHLALGLIPGCSDAKKNNF